MCDIQLRLNEWEQSKHDFLRLMISPMKLKFIKYWEECSLVLSVAVVLDPRLETDLVEYYYDKIYGSDAEKHMTRIHSALVDLYIEYGDDSTKIMESSESFLDDGSSNSGHNLVEGSKDDMLSGFDRWYVRARSATISAYQKSKLVQYLEEPLFPRKENFNILHWWKVNSAKFPTLAKMARDILAVPMTTVASESAFSVGGRIIDESHYSLLPDVVEALVTTDDWIEVRTKKC